MPDSSAKVFRSRPVRVLLGLAAMVGAARLATTRPGQIYENPPGSPVRGGGIPAGSILELLGRNRPTAPPPRRQNHVLARADALGGTRIAGDTVTWLGHAGFALRLGDTQLLIDPFLSDFASPVTGIGPRCADPSPFVSQDFDAVHAVLLSHNHYDHFDRHTLFGLPNRKSLTAIVPAGLGPDATAVGFARVVELRWGESIDVGTVQVTATPAIHFSGRGLFDRNRTHWNGYRISSAHRRIYFAGDTAHVPGLGDHAGRVGDHDLAIVPIGAYMPIEMMSPVHTNPEEAIMLAREARGLRVLGMHWGTISSLSTEAAFEPPLRFTQAGLQSGYLHDEILLPPIGGTIRLD